MEFMLFLESNYLIFLITLQSHDIKKGEPGKQKIKNTLLEIANIKILEN